MIASPEKPSEASLKKKVGIRFHPEIHKGLKVRAAQEGRSIESLIHEIFCRALNRPDLLEPGDESPLR